MGPRNLQYAIAVESDWDITTMCDTINYIDIALRTANTIHTQSFLSRY